MKNLILVLVINGVSLQLSAMKKDSLQYRNSLEFTYQRNYSFYKIISYSDAIVKDAALRLNEKKSNESAIYTNIIGLFYTYRIKPWVYIRSGFSTGTIGYVSNPELKPIYQGYKDNMGVVHTYISGYEKTTETYPGAFLNIPIHLGFQKQILQSNFTSFFLIGLEGISFSSPLLKGRNFESFEGSAIYKFQVKKNFDLSKTEQISGSAFNFYSISTGINYSFNKFRLGFFYQYREGKKYTNYLDHWKNLSIVQKGFAHGVGMCLGINF
jgi:hypothetical protein